MSISNYIYTFACIALCALLAGCQQDEIPAPQGDGTVITFNSPYTVDTRSAAMRYGSFQPGDKVGVLGFCKDQVQGNSDAAWDVKKQFCTPDVFYNQELTYDGAGAWNYSWTGRFEEQNYTDELHPWSSNEDDTFSFFAYYPYADVEKNDGKIVIEGLKDDEEYTRNGSGTIELSGRTERGDPKITYTMPFGTDGNTSSNCRWWHVPDFMLAYKVDHLKADGSVQLNFRHLLCAFEFEVNNYNDEDVIIEDFYFGGGTEYTSGPNQGENATGFYRSFTVTGQQSGYDVDPTDMYVGEFQLIGNKGNEDPHILMDFTCPANTEGTSIDYEGSPISILLIPDADRTLTTDRNQSVYIRIQARTKDSNKPIGDNTERLMNLVGKTFEPGVRNIFTINIIGNDFYVQMRSDGYWEDDGDSEIVFE